MFTHIAYHTQQYTQGSEAQPDEQLSFLPMQECMLHSTQTQTFPSIVGW